MRYHAGSQVLTTGTNPVPRFLQTWRFYDCVPIEEPTQPLSCSIRSLSLVRALCVVSKYLVLLLYDTRDSPVFVLGCIFACRGDM